ncbi:MAG: hypothetical protein R3E10_07405 [Gemmatimonadota bacterium]
MKAHQPMDPTADASLRGERGFSLVELTVGIVFFAFGTLGMAAMTAGLQRQTTLAALKTERNAALISAVEEVRSFDFDSLAAGGHTAGQFAVNWTVQANGRYVKDVQIVTAGPGLKFGSSGAYVDMAVIDTVDYQVIRP